MNFIKKSTFVAQDVDQDLRGKEPFQRIQRDV